jgi:phosphoribosylformylglycinamidine synthase
MGESTGAVVNLDKVPLKYAGLRYDEIWISEAQERMVLAVPQSKVAQLLKLAESEDVEATVIGTFGAPRSELVLNFAGTEVGRMSMEFLHNGIPTPTRKAVVIESAPPKKEVSAPLSPEAFKKRLLERLSHPNIASKHWVIRQYDHEVQGGSVVKPLVGPLQIGPSDASVIRPKLGSHRGVAIGCGMSPLIDDPYEMAMASIDEAIRNVVVVGADPDRVAILDNFCWPSVDDEETMGTLVRACEACRDAAIAYRIPFISGKDSLHNQFTNKETGQVLRIPRTLLISAIGVIEDVRKCVTMDFKSPAGCPVYLIAGNNPRDMSAMTAMHRKMAKLIADGHVAAVHDVSDGGYVVAAVEMCIASGHGLNLDPEFLASHDPFADRSGSYIVQLRETAFEAVQSTVVRHPTVDKENIFSEPTTSELDPFLEVFCEHFGSGVTTSRIGFVQTRPSLLLVSNLNPGIKVQLEIRIPELTRAWRGTLDW